MAEDRDMLRMQQDAIRRVRLMQQRARESVASGDPAPENVPPEASDSVSSGAPGTPPIPRMKLRRNLPPAPVSPLQALAGDSERTLLLVLLLLLLQEGTDPELLLALMYLLM